VELDGEDLGSVSTLSATELPNAAFDMSFNQDVGPMMTGATEEVAKFLLVRHGDDLPEKKIELSFGDRHTPKDGPSAAVATALIAQSIVSDIPLEPNIAVTGDMSATGEVQPVGGVISKLKAAAIAQVPIALVPHSNRRALQDFYFFYGIKSIARIQVISIEQFDEAWRMAKMDRDEDYVKALANFEDVSKAVLADAQATATPEVQAKLKEILEVIPNHLSARLLSLYGQRRAPQYLSLEGSLSEIDDGVTAMIDSLNGGQSAKRKKRFKERIAALARVRKKVDPRTKSYLDSFLQAGRIIGRYYDRDRLPDSVIKEIRTKIQIIDAEASKLRSNAAIQRELMGD